MKGIILAGGSGTRLYPLTKVTSKQLLPVYDKPMIYYPMATLMSAGIREMLIISTPADTPRFEALFGDGSDLGLKLSYAVQPSPDGLAQAFLIGEEFIGGSAVAMVLGDNIFVDAQDAEVPLADVLQSAARRAEEGHGATIFGYSVKDPERFGVIEFDSSRKVIGIEEKPACPKSNFCVTGLYFYDNRAVEFAKMLKPSARNELEITDLNRMYLERGELNVELLREGYSWIDAGTHESLAAAGDLIRSLQRTENRKVACLEEIAFVNGWIGEEGLQYPQ